MKTKRGHEAVAARPVMLTSLGNLPILKENRRYLEMGGSPRHWDALGGESPSRTRHLIGNPEGAWLETGELQAKTAFLVYRSPLQTDQQLHSGCGKTCGAAAHGRRGGPRLRSTPTCSSQEPQRLPLWVKTSSA
jgi:hypothetical protein